ncbi:MAG: VOC family protein [Bifidobacteriaceae bacterium]|jgi:catechol 2,3-dioxygenase-like lactoylglutathione lyase family enzyme|nr:VOC family protein [Bifidobacteriaceae bacterium]
MNAPTLATIGIVVKDMTASLAFYRDLGVDMPADADGASHVEADLPGGLRLAFDTREVVWAYDPGWTEPAGGHRIALSFACGQPAAVDAAHGRMTEGGHQGRLEGSAPFRLLAVSCRFLGLPGRTDDLRLRL